VLWTEDVIASRVAELGAAITDFYPDGDLLVLGLLKGSAIFLGDLIRRIRRPLKVDFLVAASYGVGTASSGTVKLDYDPATPLEGKHVLLVDDVVDSGKTLSTLIDLLQARRPQSVEVCALLHKHVPAALHYPVRFVGFDAPREFLVGYGLDYAEELRHLPYIGSIVEQKSVQR